MLRVIPTLVVLLAGAGCADGNPTVVSERTVGEREGDLRLSFPPLEEFTAEGDRLVSPFVRVDGGIERMGIMVGLVDAERPVSIAIRAAGDDGWTPMATQHSQQGLEVLGHRFAVRISRVQISIAATDAPAVAFLRSAVTLDRAPSFEARPEDAERALAEELSALGVIPRAGWGTSASRCEIESVDEAPKDRFSIHHTLTYSDDGTVAPVRALQAYEARGLGVCDLGYHFLVAQDGRVYEGRPLRFFGGHAGDPDPAGNVTIGFLGCFDSGYCGPLGGDDPSATSLAAAADLLTALSYRLRIPLDAGTVRAFAGCSGPSAVCAGDRLAAAIPELLRRAAPVAGDPDAGPGGEPDAGRGDDPDAGHVHDDDPTVDPTPMACGDAGCEFCASTGACRMAGEGCTWAGDVAGATCWPSFDPCFASSCWDPSLHVPACTAAAKDEDFSSGRYAVHRYAATLPGEAPVTLTLERTGGAFEPSLIVTDAVGELVFGGDPVSLRAGVTVTEAVSGRGGARASVTLESAAPLDVRVHVTGWSVVDSGFREGMPTDSRYRLSTSQTCASMPGGPSASESVGSPSSGSLRNGVRITPHPGYVIAMTGRNAYFGTEETVRNIRAGFDAVLARHPDAEVVQVRDISVEGGGAPSGPWPHSSHESGRDADLTYHLSSCSASSGCPLADAPLSTFDAAATWTLFEHWLRHDMVTYIFVDHALQAPLYEEARRRGATDAQLDRWIQYPRASSVREGIVRHIVNHRNHHHVRFRCPPDDGACVE